MGKKSGGKKNLPCVFPSLSNPYEQREELLPIQAFRSTLLSQQLIAVTTSIKQKLASKSGYPAFQRTKSIWQCSRGNVCMGKRRVQMWACDFSYVNESLHACPQKGAFSTKKMPHHVHANKCMFH